MTLPATFTFDWAKAPLSLNYRLHRMAEAKITRELRTLMHYRALYAIAPMERCEVELVWIVKDKRKRDEENIVPVLKALCDGLVDAGIVPDDTPEFMVKRMPAIRYIWDAEPRFEFTVKEA